MADVSAIADAIVTRVKTITTLANRASAFGKDYVDPPWAIVVPDPGEFIQFDSSMARGSDELTYLIKVLETAADDRAAQDRLSSYLDTSGSASIKAAVDGTLGSTVSFATVTAAQKYGEVQWAGMMFYGCEFIVRVSL